MKIVLWSLFILFLAAIALVAWRSKKIWDKIAFNIYLQSVDLAGLGLSDIPTILQGGEKNIMIMLGADIKNENNFSIPFSRLKVELFYEGNLIAESAEVSGVVPANGTLSISAPAKIILNLASTKLLTEGLLKNKPTLEYSVGLNIFGIPIPFDIKNNFVWEY